MFIGGNNAQAKDEVRHILDKFGFDTEDLGTIETSRAIEQLCRIWCIPGIARGDWSPRAFKMLH